MASATASSLGLTFGAAYIGLFGITILQTVMYYKKYPDDWPVYRYSPIDYKIDCYTFIQYLLALWEFICYILFAYGSILSIMAAFGYAICKSYSIPESICINIFRTSDAEADIYSISNFQSILKIKISLSFLQHLSKTS
ncbi:hypothetical protein ARMGADRAFT_1035994 [Armillaria gallica]|uniref:Uncharacterized protein n=1 Tax=Armillaria gallica TaxID=47427 RepID=A0A2H3CWE6_ARMGA|nr:hypothetical protein ARMGADRAFT_1035994 [Armillaria gallica]